MSLEQRIEQLTLAVTQLTELLVNSTSAISAVVNTPVAQNAPVQPVAAPVVQQSVPSALPFSHPAVAPVQQPAAPAGAPFNDNTGLVQYVMAAYSALGPERGGHIQTILSQLGCQTINDLNPAYYSTFYTAVEQLKNS
jgi:hypothetical protein